MSGRRSRSKGVRTERSIVNALKVSGIAAVRVPLSGAVGGRFAGKGASHPKVPSSNQTKHIGQ